MADVITRLKLESGEYDSKIKRATQGLLQMEQECRKVGGTLAVLEKDQLEFVKGLGKMETVSTSVRGRIGELTSAYTELASQYKRLTDEEKNGDFGKALNSSLQQLKVRINDSKIELDDINKSLNGGNGLKDALDQVAGKFGLNISQLTKFGGVLGVTTTALQVAKDAFFQSESGIDEWGRTVEGTKGAYNIFLDTLNNGNWSGFFDNLQRAIQGGRDLYDVFDRLGSIKSNNAAAIAIVQQKIAQLRLAKQQGENVDAQLKDATARLAQLQKQSINAGKDAGNKAAFEVIRNGVNSVGGVGVNDATINYVIDRIMKNGQGEFDKYSYNYDTLRKRGTRTTVMEMDDGYGGTVNKYSQTFDINLLTKEQQKQYAIAKAVTEGETRIQKGISAYAQAVQEGTASAREEFKGNRYALQGSGGRGVSGGGGGKTTSEYIPLEGSIDAQTKKVQDLQKAWRAAADDDSRTKIKAQIDEAQRVLDIMEGKTKTLTIDLNKVFPDRDVSSQQGSGLTDFENMKQSIQAEIAFDKMEVDETSLHNLMQTAIQNGIDGLDPDFSSVQEQIREGFDIDDSLWQEIVDKLNEKLAEMKLEPIKINFETGQVAQDGEAAAKAWKKAGGAIQTTAGIFNSIENPAAKIMGTIGQAIATIALAYAETLVQSKEKKNVWAFIATAAAAMVSMASTISSIHSSTGYAEGGVIKGSTYSGDMIAANNGAIGLNAGEVVLNRAQSGVLAASLEGAGGNGGRYLPSHVSGEQIWIALNAYTRRSGKGELVTWR